MNNAFLPALLPRWLLILALAFSQSANADEISADLILTNGKFYTSFDKPLWQQAVAIRDGVLVAVGSEQEIQKFKGKQTQVLDLGGRAVLPGFYDMHAHPMMGGVYSEHCAIPQGLSLAKVLDIVKQCVQKAEPGASVTGGQWDLSAFDQTPNREMLDKVAPNTPVLLYDTSGHSAWANSKAFEAVGITKDTPDPERGSYDRDEDNVPTGLVHETGVWVLREALTTQPTDEAMQGYLSFGLNKLLSHGVTSITDAALGYGASLDREIKLYATMVDAGRVKQRVRLCMLWMREEDVMWEGGTAAIELAIQNRNLYARSRVKPDCIKLVLDGVPTKSQTAALLEPYEGGYAEGSESKKEARGVLNYDQQTLNELLARFDRMGLAVKMHSAGDAAARSGLTAIEYARKENGMTGPLHDIAHSTFVNADDISRAVSIGATYELSPYLWSPAPINDDISSAVGQRRIERIWPFRELIDAGALVVPGADWPVVEFVNPWPAVESMITREMPGGGDVKFGAAQAITLSEALTIFTVNSARHMGHQNEVGQIEAGLYADLIVLDRDPFKIPTRELHKVQVDQTIISGEVVYDRRD